MSGSTASHSDTFPESSLHVLSSSASHTPIYDLDWGSWDSSTISSSTSHVREMRRVLHRTMTLQQIAPSLDFTRRLTLLQEVASWFNQLMSSKGLKARMATLFKESREIHSDTDGDHKLFRLDIKTLSDACHKLAMQGLEMIETLQAMQQKKSEQEWKKDWCQLSNMDLFLNEIVDLKRDIDTWNHSVLKVKTVFMGAASLPLAAKNPLLAHVLENGRKLFENLAHLYSDQNVKLADTSINENILGKIVQYEAKAKKTNHEIKRTSHNSKQLEVKLIPRTKAELLNAMSEHELLSKRLFEMEGTTEALQHTHPVSLSLRSTSSVRSSLPSEITEEEDVGVNPLPLAALTLELEACRRLSIFMDKELFRATHYARELEAIEVLANYPCKNASPEQGAIVTVVCTDPQQLSPPATTSPGQTEFESLQQEVPALIRQKDVDGEEVPPVTGKYEPALVSGKYLPKMLSDTAVGRKETQTTWASGREKTLNRPKAPSDWLKTPSDGIKTPLDGLKTPSHRLKTPSHRLKTPSDGIKTPLDGLKAPSHRLKTPSHRLKTPSDVLKTPLDGLKTPSHRLKTPLDGLNAPSDVSFGTDLRTGVSWEERHAVFSTSSTSSEMHQLKTVSLTDLFIESLSPSPCPGSPKSLLMRVNSGTMVKSASEENLFDVIPGAALFAKLRSDTRDHVNRASSKFKELKIRKLKGAKSSSRIRMLFRSESTTKSKTLLQIESQDLEEQTLEKQESLPVFEKKSRTGGQEGKRYYTTRPVSKDSLNNAKSEKLDYGKGLGTPSRDAHKTNSERLDFAKRPGLSSEELHGKTKSEQLDYEREKSDQKVLKEEEAEEDGDSTQDHALHIKVFIGRSGSQKEKWKTEEKEKEGQDSDKTLRTKYPPPVGESSQERSSGSKTEFYVVAKKSGDDSKPTAEQRKEMKTHASWNCQPRFSQEGVKHSEYSIYATPHLLSRCLTSCITQCAASSQRKLLPLPSVTKYDRQDDTKGSKKDLHKAGPKKATSKQKRAIRKFSMDFKNKFQEPEEMELGSKLTRLEKTVVGAEAKGFDRLQWVTMQELKKHGLEDHVKTLENIDSGWKIAPTFEHEVACFGARIEPALFGFESTICNAIDALLNQAADQETLAREKLGLSAMEVMQRMNSKLKAGEQEYAEMFMSYHRLWAYYAETRVHLLLEEADILKTSASMLKEEEEQEEEEEAEEFIPTIVDAMPHAMTLPTLPSQPRREEPAPASLPKEWKEDMVTAKEAFHDGHISYKEYMEQVLMLLKLVTVLQHKIRGLGNTYSEIYIKKSLTLKVNNILAEIEEVREKLDQWDQGVQDMAVFLANLHSLDAMERAARIRQEELNLLLSIDQAHKKTKAALHTQMVRMDTLKESSLSSTELGQRPYDLALEVPEEEEEEESRSLGATGLGESSELMTGDREEESDEDQMIVDGKVRPGEDQMIVEGTVRPGAIYCPLSAASHQHVTSLWLEQSESEIQSSRSLVETFRDELQLQESLRFAEREKEGSDGRSVEREKEESDGRSVETEKERRSLLTMLPTPPERERTGRLITGRIPLSAGVPEKDQTSPLSLITLSQDKRRHVEPTIKPYQTVLSSVPKIPKPPDHVIPSLNSTVILKTSYRPHFGAKTREAKPMIPTPRVSDSDRGDSASETKLAISSRAIERQWLASEEARKDREGASERRIQPQEAADLKDYVSNLPPAASREPDQRQGPIIADQLTTLRRLLPKRHPAVPEPSSLQSQSAVKNVLNWVHRSNVAPPAKTYHPLARGGLGQERDVQSTLVHYILHKQQREKGKLSAKMRRPEHLPKATKKAKPGQAIPGREGNSSSAGQDVGKVIPECRLLCLEVDQSWRKAGRTLKLVQNHQLRKVVTEQRCQHIWNKFQQQACP